VRSIQLIQSASDPANSATLCATRNVALSDSRTPARPATSGFKLLVRLVDQVAAMQFAAVQARQHVLGTHRRRRRQERLRDELHRRTAQMVQFIDGSGLDANVVC
jgi:hypothetical protein